MTKQKNALTHGVYAKEVLLPWEDAQAFDNLHQAIRGELKPSSFLQEQTVFDIAKEHWRKQRLAISYALPFHQNPMTPELMAAAKGGVAGLAAYLADPSNRGTTLIATEDLLRLIERHKEAARITRPFEDEIDENKLDELSKKKTKPITAEIVERAYDLVNLEKHLKLETMIDNRIKCLFGKFYLLKHEEMYGQKEIQVLPPAEVPGPHPSNTSPSNGSPIIEGDSQASH